MSKALASIAALELLCLSLLAALSWGALDPAPWPIDPIFLAVGLMMTAGLAYMALPAVLARQAPTVRSIVAMVLVGLALRLVLLASVPILEIDYFRYLWDGGVLAAGLNPYAVAPAEVLAGTAPEAWQALGQAAGDTLEQINYPHLTTIYPSLAQGAFALAHWLEPWSLSALRLTLLGFELAGLALLLLLLRELGRSPLWAALYWWNPLVAKELINSAHMDALLVPVILGALLLAARGRGLWSSALLALAAGIKLWPALLLPSLLRPLWPRRLLVLAATALFAVLAALLLAPQVLTKLDGGAGLVAYAQGWERNDALFGLLRGATALLLEAFGLFHWNAERLARALLAVILIGLSLGLNLRAAQSATILCQRTLFVVAALFLLSPTGYPWYFVWLAPLLAVVPVTGLLALTVMLPLYYLRFYFAERGQAEVFDTYVVWLEFAPVYLLLLAQALGRVGRQVRTGPLALQASGR